MAKVTGPLLSFGARGSIGGAATFATWKGQPYVRQLVTPSNPQSVEQTATRNVFSIANEIWKSAPALFIAPWDRFAQGQVLTGRNAFVGRYVSVLRGALDIDGMIMSPGAKGGLAALTQVITPGTLQMTVDVTVPAAPPGWTLQAAISACILDGDPAVLTNTTVTAVEDVATPYSNVLTGLPGGSLFWVGSWTRYAKPDGSIAYGPSIGGFGSTL